MSPELKNAGDQIQNAVKFTPPSAAKGAKLAKLADLKKDKTKTK